MNLSVCSYSISIVKKKRIWNIDCEIWNNSDKTLPLNLEYKGVSTVSVSPWKNTLQNEIKFPSYLLCGKL